MKTVIVLVVLLGLAVAGVYFFGGYRTLNPDEQGTNAKAAIKTGMSWTKVLDVAGPTPRYVSRSILKEKDGTETIKEGTEVEFDRSKLATKVKNGQVPAGFKFIYRFSQRVAFQVTFDSSGNVEEVADIMTEADLLHTR
jgi:hypothetical protein